MDDILSGPVSGAVIVDNSYHVSSDVWNGVERGPLECMSSNRSLRHWVLSDAQREILHMVGFGVFANLGIVLQNDTRLVSALVERWRPETNTFFMRQGEMTVTLEDVGYILGLPVVGRPLVGDGIDGNQSYFERAWFEELTPHQVKDGFTRGGVRLTWLFETYGSADPGPDPRRIAVHTQAYMFFVVGSILFPTSSRNVVHPRYIRHLRTLSHVRTWSWGSAVLSYLYRGLTTAAQKGLDCGRQEETGEAG
ncbi:protein MAIN-LIKE 1-like [Daucus carota subsp. sativus]|uniref:protein MAIN-LIKE 1-like n=1 Tax=Daucus carota subsp. sativus TaxID=79200 RepID=UPI0030826F89